MATVTTKPSGLSGAVGFGMDGVVMVLGVGRVDSDERQRAPILALKTFGFHARGFGRFGGFDGFWAEKIGNAMDIDGDEADRLLGIDRPQPFAHLGDGKAHASARKRFDTDEIAVARLAAIGL